MLVGITVALGAVVTPDAVYRQQWKTPKYFDLDAFRCVVVCIVAFCSCSFAAHRVASRWTPWPKGAWNSPLSASVLRRMFVVSFWLCVVGYLAWMGAAIARGVTPALVWGVFTGSKGAASAMKETYLVTISGVTTLTQFGIVTIILGCLLCQELGWKRVVPQCSVVFLFALLRAVLNSERLALIELLVPGIVLFVHLYGPGLAKRASLRNALNLAPVAAGAGAFTVFSVFEYFRSWVNFYSDSDTDFLSFAAQRLLGYYVTALNNGAYLIRQFSPLNVPYESLHFLWRFPLLKNITEAVFPNVPIAAEGAYMDILSVGANPEFNNGGGLLLPVVDFGLLGAVCYWAVMGCVCGILFAKFCKYRPAGLLLYPILFTGISESPRILYWADGRTIPAFAMLALCGFLCRVYEWRYAPAGCNSVNIYSFSHRKVRAI